MSRLQDFVTDNNPTAIFHADREIGIPDYVKSASVITQEDVSDLSSAGFADKANGLFPIFSKAATWLSAAYFLGNKFKDPVTEANIKAAAEVFEITDDLKVLESLFSSLENQASDSVVKYALTVDFGENFDGGVHNFYPIGDAGEILVSSELMLKDASSGALPIEYLRSAAKELVKAASDHGVSADEFHTKIQELGTLRMPDFEAAKYGMSERSKYAGLSSEALEEYKIIVEGAQQEFSKHAFESSEEAINSMEKWAELWCELDREHGVKYANVCDPYKSFFQGVKLEDFEKMAAENFFIGDVMIPVWELTALSENSLDANFSKEDAATIKTACVLAKQPTCAMEAEEISRTLSVLDDDTQKDLLRMMVSNY